MRLTASFLASLFALPLALTACSDNKNTNDEDAEPFATLQACYDEHHGVESLPVAQAIVTCCVDHPINGVHPSCGTTQPECVSHVRTELDASVTDTEISAACMDYASQI